MSEPPQKRSKSEKNDQEANSDDKLSDLVKEYRELLKNYQFQRYDYLNKAEEFYKKGRTIEKKIMEICNHKWVPDRDCCDHRTVFICEKCYLNR